MNEFESAVWCKLHRIENIIHIRIYRLRAVLIYQELSQPLIVFFLELAFEHFVPVIIKFNHVMIIHPIFDFCIYPIITQRAEKIIDVALFSQFLHNDAARSVTICSH